MRQSGPENGKMQRKITFLLPKCYFWMVDFSLIKHYNAIIDNKGGKNMLNENLLTLRKMKNTSLMM